MQVLFTFSKFVQRMSLFMALSDRYCAATKCRLFIELAESGLASMYPALCWSVGSWPSWISARMRPY